MAPGSPPNHVVGLPKEKLAGWLTDRGMGSTVAGKGGSPHDL